MKKTVFLYALAFVPGLFWAGFQAEPTFAQMRVPPAGEKTLLLSFTKAGIQVSRIVPRILQALVRLFDDFQGKLRFWIFVIACLLAQATSAQDDSLPYDIRDFLPEYPEVRIMLDGYVGSDSNPEFTLDPKTFARGRKGKWVILLNDDTRIRLWGLNITDIERASRFLIGRPLVCIVLHEQQDLFTVDCKAAPVADIDYLYRGSLTGWLDPHVTLPQFELAKPICTGWEINSPIITTDAHSVYRCDPDRMSIRTLNVLVSETPIEPW